MVMPGNVPNFSVYLVDFDHLESVFAIRPPGTTLRAWDKLEELERRLNAFDWATMVVRQPRQCTTLISDLAFAFVLGFEATVQVLKHERAKPGFDAWLTTRPEYDIQCRGIQTLRNLEAHVRSGQMHAGVGQGVYTRFMSSMTPQPGAAWRFPPISPAEYNSLKPHGRKLALSEVDDWNRLVDSEFAANIMRTALMSLVAIVKQV
jgi:hypothetical protein